MSVSGWSLYQSALVSPHLLRPASPLNVTGSAACGTNGPTVGGPPILCRGGRCRDKRGRRDGHIGNGPVRHVWGLLPTERWVRTGRDRDVVRVVGGSLNLFGDTLKFDVKFFDALLDGTKTFFGAVILNDIDFHGFGDRVVTVHFESSLSNLFLGSVLNSPF